MLISVIIPFYKELSLIGRAVRSVFAQQLPDRHIAFELIIGNDGPIGNDEILDAIDECHRASVKIVKNNGPHGPGGARNAALEQATGDLIAFLDADDYWMPEKITLQLERIDRGETFVATGYRFEDADVAIKPPSQIARRTDIFLRLGIGTSTVLLTRALCQNALFRPLRFAQDIDYWYLLSASPLFRFGSVRSPCVVYSRSGSTRNKLIQLRAFIRVLSLNRIPLRARLPIVLGYSMRGVINHYLRPH